MDARKKFEHAFLEKIDSNEHFIMKIATIGGGISIETLCYYMSIVIPPKSEAAIRNMYYRNNFLKNYSADELCRIVNEAIQTFANDEDDLRYSYNRRQALLKLWNEIAFPAFQTAITAQEKHRKTWLSTKEIFSMVQDDSPGSVMCNMVVKDFILGLWPEDTSHGMTEEEVEWLRYCLRGKPQETQKDKRKDVQS